MIQSATNPAIKHKLPIASFQSFPDSKQHIRIILLHRMSDDLLALRYISQRIKISHDKIRLLSLQISIAAICSDQQIAFF